MSEKHTATPMVGDKFRDTNSGYGGRKLWTVKRVHEDGFFIMTREDNRMALQADRIPCDFVALAKAGAA